MDGTSSNDRDGTISVWLWKKISGSASFVIQKTAAAKTIIRDLDTGVYAFELMIKDDGGLSAKDTIQISVNDMPQKNRPPVANPGGNKYLCN